VKELAALALCLLGACTEPPQPFTYELYVNANTMPRIAIDGDATFEHQSWDFASYADATATFVLDMTYGLPPNHIELRPEGCELDGHGPPPHDLTRLKHQRVTIAPTPPTIDSMWCEDDSASWGSIQ
jgi:hypothetical protein